MATVTTLVDDPLAVVPVIGTHPLLPFPPATIDPVDELEQAATVATYVLRLPHLLLSLDGVYVRLLGSGFTYAANAPAGTLPAGGTITSIEFGGYTGPQFGMPVTYTSTTHRVVLGTPVAAADFAANRLDLSALLYGGADSMLGAAVGADHLMGYLGNDTLDGLGGADTLDGGGGHDVLTGGAGDDVLLGQADNDQLRPAQGEDSAFGGDGNDTILVSDAGGSGLFPEADLLDGGSGADMLRIVHGGGNVMLHGAAITGIETLRIEIGTPWLGAAQLVGFGTIELASGAGAFTSLGVIGGGVLDLDALPLAPGTAAGLHLLLSDTGAAPGGPFIIAGRDTGSFVNDRISGSQSGDSLNLRTGNDTASGSGGDDLLLGGAGADNLAGDAGADRLSGEDGADTLAGGAGADTLTGGIGGDRFLFKGSDLTIQGETDRIADFNRIAGDIIDLSGIDAQAGVAGDQAFSGPATLSGAAAPPPAGSLRYEVKRDHTLLHLYTDADAVADFLIRVAGPGFGTPVASDFVL